jgi:glycosyltransferase involved in cell wall biosynthesis
MSCTFLPVTTKTLVSSTLAIGPALDQSDHRVRPTTASVSVIIPAFNSERVIARALDSVVADLESFLEVIVVDDGSTDRTADAVARYPQVRYLAQQNSGPAAARNAGARAARGDMLYFLDADDEMIRGGLKHLSATLEAFPEAGAVSGVVLYENNGERRRVPPDGFVLRDRGGRGLLENYFEIARATWIVGMGSFLVRASAFNAVGGFRERLRLGEDVNLWDRIAGRFEWAFVDQPVFVYHHDPLVSTSFRTPECHKPTDFLLSEAEMRAEVRPSLWESYRRYRRDVALRRARQALYGGARQAAREYLSNIAPSELNAEWLATKVLAALPVSLSRGALSSVLRIRQALRLE